MKKKKQFNHTVGYGQRRDLGPFSVRIDDNGSVVACVRDDDDSRPDSLEPGVQKQYGEYTLRIVERMGRRREVQLALTAPSRVPTK